MSITESLDAGVVVLNDYAFELAVQPGIQNVTPFAEKITFGDFTRASDALSSVWVLTDWTGGFLKRRLKADTDTDRFWDSTAETRYTTELRLPPLVTPLSGWTGYPASGDTPTRSYATSALEFVDTSTAARPTRLIVAFWDPTHSAAHLRKLDVTNERWVDPGVGNSVFAAEPTYTAAVASLTQPITRPIVALMDDRIWWVFPSHAGILWYGSTWDFQAGDSSDGAPCPKADRVVCWDQKLFGLESDTGAFWMITSILDHINSPSAWDRRATLPVRAYDCQHLVVFRNSAGEPVIHAICKEDVWAYDYAADQWVGPVVTYPRQYDSAEGCANRRGTLFIGNGTSVLGYDTNTLRDVGLGKDWGLPAYRSGPVYRLADSNNWLAAGLDTTVPGNTVRAGVYLWDEVGWHHLWLSSVINTNITWLHHSFADQQARLYWGVQGTLENEVYSADMPQGVFNPRDVSTTEYAETATLITGWTSMNWEEQPKTAIALDYRVEDCSTSETVTISYALDDDEDDSAWVALGTIQESGAGTLPCGTGGFGLAATGTPFRTIRLKVDLARGSTTTVTPVVRFLGLRFVRRPRPIYAYTLTLVIRPEGFNGLTASEQEQALMALLDEQQLLQLAFRKDGFTIGRVPAQGVFPTHWSGTPVSGSEAGGRYQISLVEYSSNG